jgi:cell wall-associated NlpC family hydrolase
MTPKKITLLLVFLILPCLYSFHGDINSTHPTINDVKFISKSDLKLISIIDNSIEFGKTLLGKPYRYVKDGMVLDCSGLISYIFVKNGYDLPRSIYVMVKTTKRINISEVQKGDLLFFKTRNIKSNNLGHVAIVTDVIDNQIEMMHSCNRGIIIENYNKNNYYTSRLLSAGRLY